MPRKKKTTERKGWKETSEEIIQDNLEKIDNEEVVDDKKVKENPEEEPLKEEDKKKQNKQIMIAVVLMVVVIGAIILTPFVYGKFFSKFTYINLEFQKTRLGDLKFYSTRIPVMDQVLPKGELFDRNERLADYSINLREDPRKLDFVKVNLTYNNTNQLDFVKENIVYISFDPKMKKCDDNSIALIDFSGFLKEFAMLKVKSAVPDKNASEELKIPYITCKENPWNTVINIRSGNETKIEKTGLSCYELTYKDCEITAVTEKFNLILIEQYMKDFKEEKSWWMLG